MVQAHKLSASIILTLLRDLQSYKNRCKEPDNIDVGAHLPRTDLGWLISHFKDAEHKRNSVIAAAIKQYNRSRGNPVDEQIFKTANQYANCLVQLEINQNGEVVYKGAADSIWNSHLKKYEMPVCCANIDIF